MSETRSVETTAPDIETAIEEGLKLLDVERGNVIVDIIEEPTRGLLGIGARLARVRLTTTIAPRSERPEFKPSISAKPSPPPPPAPKPVATAKPTPKPAPPPPPTTTTVTNDVDLPEAVRLGVQTLRELLHHMDIPTEVTIEKSAPENELEEDTTWILNVHGDELGLLIGHRGKTLAALQYLTRLIAGRDLQQRADFVVDVENYKARRQVLLKRLALRLADDAIRRRRTIEMEPMPPHERRIIHMTLRNHAKVTTQSVGEGDRRRVTIVPKR
ncbi:MAG: Jag N-terminal domain-containing protein [Anaerolineales bacterium]|nr:Jag N-terminal domain-containing protein [Anaerolineales bacterium]